MLSHLAAVALCCVSFPDKDELRRIALSNVSQIEHLKLAWMEKQAYVSGQLDPGIIEELRAEVLCNADFSRFVLTEAHRPTGEQAIGPKRTSLADGSGKYYALHEGAAAVNVASKPFSHRWDVPPLQLGLLFAQANGTAEPAEDSILTLIDTGRISGTETVGDIPCVKLEVGKNGKVDKCYWLALDKGCVPVRLEMYNVRGEVTARGDIVVESFDGAHGEHVWLPTSCTSQMTIDGAVIKRTTTVDRNSVVINPAVTPGTFRMEYAPGMRIADTTGAGVVFYKVNENGEWVPAEG